MIEKGIRIIEEDTETGGHFQSEDMSFDIPASTGWHEFTHSFPFPVSMLAGQTFVAVENDGDEMEFHFGPKTIIGGITGAVAAGQKLAIPVQQSVIDNIAIGKTVHLDDGTNEDLVGRVLEVDEGNLTIDVETETVNAFSHATPTYVKMTTTMVRHMLLRSGARTVIGDSKIGGSYVPANTVFQLRYKNNDGVAKKFAVMMEYLY